MANNVLKRICVFCGSKTGNNGAYREAATQLGQLLAEREQTLVFGGGSVGLMGVIADAALEDGGEVIGVIPEPLSTKELLHTRVRDMRRVPDMHARKALMNELSDGFIALPGGYGTFEELFEAITWAQLGFHAKPIGLLNVAGYFDPLVVFLERAITEGFINQNHRRLIVVADEPDEMLTQLEEHKMPSVRRWLGDAQV